MLKLLSLTASFLVAGALSVAAATVEFKPPNDPIGRVATTNRNDGWSVGRGIGLTVSSDQTINSVGLFQDLTNIALSFSIHEISVSSSDTFTRGAALRSGGSTVTTQGLEWIDYSFANLTLSAGTNYLLDFVFSGDSNQNFFYFNLNIPWSQGSYSFLEGTQGNSFFNGVVAAFRVNDVTPVPVPAGAVLLMSGLGLLVLRRRRAV